MALPRRSTYLLLTAILYLATFVPATQALSVQKKAAVGISVGFGALLILAALGGSYLIFYKRKARREARERGEVEFAQPKYTNKELIEMHARTAPKQFDIWGNNQPDLEDVRRKKAAREAREAGQ